MAAGSMRRRRFTAIALVGTASVLLALPGGALSSRERAQAAGNFAVSVQGLATVSTSYNSTPSRFDYSISIQYVGPTLTGPVEITFTDQLPAQVLNPGMSSPDAHLSNCTFPPQGVTAGVVSCTAYFDPTHLTNAFVINVRPDLGATGDGTSTLTLSTGESASWTTQFFYTAPPPPPPPPPPPIPGPAAAAPQTVVETFTHVGAAEPEAVRIAPSAQTAQLALTWPDANSSFDVTGITLVPTGKYLAAAVKLKISKIRKNRSLDVRIKNIRRGKLKFKIVAKKLSKATRVKTTIRQSKR
jgi:hypothetical protein